MEQPQQTPEQKYAQTLANALARQRDQALNAAAELETRLQLATEEVEQLKQQLAAAQPGQPSQPSQPGEPA